MLEELENFEKKKKETIGEEAGEKTMQRGKKNKDYRRGEAGRLTKHTH